MRNKRRFLKKITYAFNLLPIQGKHLRFRYDGLCPAPFARQCRPNQGTVSGFTCSTKKNALRRFFVEQVKGIEPSSKAWEALILPMNYTCNSVRVLY